MSVEGIQTVETASEATEPVVNIAARLTAMAAARPYALAALCPSGRDRAFRARYTHLTFRQLDDISNAWARWLTERQAIGRGTRTVVMVKPSLGFFALTFGLFKAGAVPVLIDPGMGLKNLGRCLDEAEPEAFIGIPKALRARKLLGWGRRTIRTAFALMPDRVRPTPYPNDTRLDAPFLCPTRGDETAAILFTSGSTGPPKGAVYTHAIFENQVTILRDLYGIEPGEIDLCTFPLFALFAPALGMTSIIPAMDPTRPAKVEPAYLWEPITNFGVTNLFGSPALLNRVAEWYAKPAQPNRSDVGWISEAQSTIPGSEDGGLRCAYPPYEERTFPTLRRVVSAGAPVPARVIEAFKTLVGPEAQIFTPYGATEALPVCSIGSDEILGETRFQTERGAGVCVGRPVPGVEVRIIGISDDPIPEWADSLLVPDGEIGEITVKGPIVTREYFHRLEATALAKIVDPGQGGFFHRMGDLGYRDDRGRIWFCGRKSHRVRTASGTLYTIPCEAIFNTHPAVSRTALVGIGSPGQQRPVLCVELFKPSIRPARELERLRTELLERGAHYSQTKEIATILFRRAFPVDIRHNAKIFREKLAVWAARRVR